MAWFQRDCPIDPDDRAWADGALTWLALQVGGHAVHAAVLRPTDELVAQARAGTEAELRALADRLGRHLGVDLGQITVGEFGQTSEEDVVQLLPGGVSRSLRAGHFRTTAGGVFLAVESYVDMTPPQLVASVTHELSHLRLSTIDPSAAAAGSGADDEELVDLISVYFGLGIIAANACFDSTKIVGLRTATFTTSLIGFLTEPMYGYALARYALLRDEPDPDWARYLDVNPRTYLRQSLRFLADDRA